MQKGLDALCDVIGAERLAPLFVLDPHELGLGNVKLARAEEAKKGIVVETVVSDCLDSSGDILGVVTLSQELCAELLESSLLGGIAGVSVVLDRGQRNVQVAWVTR